MPWISFIATSLWLMVLGLVGPAVPQIIEELDLSYSSAGLIFTLMSAGSLLGSLIAGILSDSRRRKQLWMLLCLVLAIGLVLFSKAPGFHVLLVTIFILSLFGGPIGAVGQSIMLEMYPEKRESYVPLQTMFAAAGSFVAPLILALVLVSGGDWRTAFLAAGGLSLLLLIWISFLNIPVPGQDGRARARVVDIITNSSIILVGVLIFLAVGVDLGFSYWLAEYFFTNVGASAEMSSIAVSAYLCGVIAGRFALSRCARRSWSLKAVMAGLVVATLAIVLLLNIGGLWGKLILCVLYGLALGPLFPYLLAKGTGLYPDRPGAVTGVLFSMMSLSGIVFPLFIGIIGTSHGIEGAYYAIILVNAIIFPGVLLVAIRISKAESGTLKG